MSCYQMIKVFSSGSRTSPCLPQNTSDPSCTVQHAIAGPLLQHFDWPGLYAFTKPAHIELWLLFNTAQKPPPKKRNTNEINLIFSLSPLFENTDWKRFFGNDWGALASVFCSDPCDLSSIVWIYDPQPLDSLKVTKGISNLDCLCATGRVWDVKMISKRPGWITLPLALPFISTFFTVYNFFFFHSYLIFWLW